MANPEHVELVKQGAEAIARWREQNLEECLYFSVLDLSGANLILANLNGADLSRADLVIAKIRGVNLSGADLSEANLSGVDVTGADLIEADLSFSNLRGANLNRANLSRANLAEADFNGAICRLTVFADCDLHQTHGLEAVVHKGPSTIGVDTVIASFRAGGNRLTPELETFFWGAGVPGELLAKLPGILAEVQYCTCFICYGEPDHAFAQKLCHDLETKGVSCWLYSMDATPGERTWREIGQKRRDAEKMVVLCSANALVRDGVLKEIEEQIDEDQDKMVPISLDDLWRAPGFRVMRGNTDLKPSLYPVRNYVDFSDAASYEKSLERLLKGLKRKQS